MVSQQGQNASLSGRDMEDMVEDRLKRAGFRLLDAPEKRALTAGSKTLEDLGDRWYTRHVKLFPGLYGVKLFLDFFVYLKDQHPHGLIIECKSQEQAGSVDEKYVYTVLSLKKMTKEHRAPSWLVFSGSGVRPCAMEWMRNQNNATFRVMTEGEMRKMVRQLFPTP